MDTEVQTKYPIEDWVRMWMSHLRSGVAHGASLMLRGYNSNSGPLIWPTHWQPNWQWFWNSWHTWSRKPSGRTVYRALTPSPRKEGSSADTWYTDMFSHGTDPQWTAVTTQPSKELLWFKSEDPGQANVQSCGQCGYLWCIKKVPYMCACTVWLSLEGNILVVGLKSLGLAGRALALVEC